MGNAVFLGMPAPRPLDRFSKKGTVDYVGDPTPHASFGVNRFKGACLCMHEIVTLRHLFFLFFKVSCASLQVGPLDRSSLTAQMTRPRGHHVLFMVLLIRKIFSLFFYQKMWKIALHPMGTLNSYNFGTIEDMYKLFSPNRGFSGLRNQTVSFKFTPDWPLLPRQPVVVISTQNWP